MIEVVRTHLELRGLAALRPGRAPTGNVRLEHYHSIVRYVYRTIYAKVGGPWRWRDRFIWTDAEIDAYLSSPDVAIWVLAVDDELAGYFELQRHSVGHVEIAYFGLVRAFMGRGLGGWLLTRAVEESFRLGADRVTLHTCTLDAAAALPNYLARGFVPVREERYFVEDEETTLSS